VKRVASLFRTVAEPGEDGLPILSVSIHDGVSDKEMSEDELDRKVTRSEDKAKYIRVEPRDLVYNMMRAWQGAFGTVTTNGMVSPAYIVARPVSDLSTDYVERLLRTPQAIEQMRRLSRGVTDFRLRLYWDEFKNIRLPVPPSGEVSEMVAGIRVMEASFDRLEAVAQESISLLTERRSALISAAVTGQIDVRNAVPEVSA
jgi:type I restriction enzyme S subunit